MQGDAYRGEDRRLEAAARTTMSRAELGAGTAIVVGAWLAAWVLPDASGAAPLLTGVPGASPLLTALTGVPGASPLLAAAAAALGVVVGTLCVARWMVAGEAPALLLGGAALAYGILRLASPASAGLQPTGAFVVLGLLVAGLLAPRVDTRVRPLTVLGGGVVLLAVGAALPLGGPGLLAAWSGVLALGYGLRGWRWGHWLFASFALLLAALALAALSPHPSVVHLAGLALALRGALRQLLVGYRDQSASLLSTRVSLATAEDRIRASRQRAEEQAHEARSALAAIEGASSTLERYRDRLPAETRAQLLEAVKGEIRRLQRLVDPGAEPLATFSVDALLRPILAAERARGTTVADSVPAELCAAGRSEATADVLRALLDNARRYAPGPVTVRATGHEGKVRIRVADRGPGVPPKERAAIFARGARGSAAGGVAGSGLGLAIAAELAREQGGRLWVEERDGGGAAFVLELASAVRADGFDDGGQRPQEDVLTPPVDGDGAHTVVGFVGQAQDHPRQHPGRQRRDHGDVGGGAVHDVQARLRQHASKRIAE